jgi:hypothetical protein
MEQVFEWVCGFDAYRPRIAACVRCQVGKASDSSSCSRARPILARRGRRRPSGCPI